MDRIRTRRILESETDATEATKVLVNFGRQVSGGDIPFVGLIARVRAATLKSFPHSREYGQSG